MQIQLDAQVSQAQSANMKKIVVGISVIAILLLGRGCYVLSHGYYGAAANVTELEKVYAVAGPAYAAFSKSSFIQNLPFDGLISWHRTVPLRSEPFIFITGRVDVAVFKKKMANEQFKLFFDETQSGENLLARFESAYRAEGDWVILTDGSLDLSGTLKMRSMMLERKMEGDEWYHFTNSTTINFDFNK